MGNNQMTIKYINEIADALTNNHAALMVGSGFSKNAERIINTDKKFLDWNELADKLYNFVHDKDQNDKKECENALRLAQEVEAVWGRPKLDAILKEAIPDSEYAPSELYVKLMEMPWRDVFTTNYDTLLERASEKVTSRCYNVVTSQEDLINSNDAPRIIKLHGSFPSQRPFIITEEDYRTYPNKFAAMVNTVQQALLENVFCMLGFSCEDPNFVNWIGWIHDNLGANNSQKLYMVSVSPVPETRKQLFFKQNILIIDLAELWPNEDIAHRIELFIGELAEKVEEKVRQEKWIDISRLNLKPNDSYQNKIQILKTLNDSYPGWIFMPWKTKCSVDILLQIMGRPDKFDGIEFDEKINFVYEYVKFLDIAGIPIISQYTEKFWDILNENNENEINGDMKPEQEHKVQVIYLQLLRSYRELAEWEKYDNCYKKIDQTLLNYDEKCFLSVCDWWSSLYRFQSVNLKEKLDKWILYSGDVYWTMIKASLYIIIGEIPKAESMLTDDLTLVRRALFKTEKKEYLSSIEVCIVSLINFIKQGPETEESVYEKDISWWYENEQYCSNLKSEEINEKSFEIKENYDLSQTYTTRMGNDNKGVLHALEYLRFIEQTGHPFRIQNTTYPNGLQSTVKILSPYYPHWCFMQVIIARGTKLLDSLFGRVRLSCLTLTEVDGIADNYIEAVKVVMANIKPKYSLDNVSIYNQAAAVLPEILARLCYKCSTNILDEILNIMLDICTSNVRCYFKNIKNVFKGLFSAYTIQEEKERIGKILEFPIYIDKTNNYYDPIIYFSIPKEKYCISEDIYNKAIIQIKGMLLSDQAEKREAATDRLISLARIVNLKEEDKNYLYELLEAEPSQSNNVALYVLDSKKYSSKVNEIFNTTLQAMKKNSEIRGLSFGVYGYEALINVLNGLDIHKVDLQSAFSVMTNLIKNYISLAQNNPYLVDRSIKECFIIASGLLILQYKDKGKPEGELLVQINNYLSALCVYLPKMRIINALWSCLGVDIDVLYDEFCVTAWMCEDEELEYITYFYNEINVNEYPISENKNLMKYTEVVDKVAVYKVVSNDFCNNLQALRLCYSLLQNNICMKPELDILVSFLSKIKDVSIEEQDDEKNARLKLQCRIEACKIAKLLYVSGLKYDAVEQWKAISENKEEFAEIRNISFAEADE